MWLLAFLADTRMNALALQTPPNRAIAPFGEGAPALAVDLAGPTRRAAGGRKIRGPVRNGSWNFGNASLYNAAMLPSSSSAGALAAGVVGVMVTMTRPRSILSPVLLGGLCLSLFMGLAPRVAAAAPAAGTTTPKKTGTTPKKSTPKKAEPGKAATGTSTRTSAGNKSISLDDDFLVEGKLEKPSAFYVLRRSATDYDWARLDAVFTPLVLESVQDPLF